MTKKVVNKFSLKIKDKEFSNWNQMSVYTSMNSISGTFGFLGMDFSRGDFDKWKIKLGDEAKVYIEDTCVICGYVDSIPITYGPDIFEIQFIGRDKTADLIDCSFNSVSKEFKKQSRRNIINRLCSPFDIEVFIDSSVSLSMSTVLDTFKADEGQSVFELISNICRDAGAIPISIGDGKLTISKTTTEKTTDAIKFNVNAVRAQLHQDNTNRFSEYICKGYGIGSDNKNLSDFIQPSGKFEDAIINRKRPLIFFSDRATDIGKCRERARWEARVRAGLSRSITYQIPGWMQSDKSVWRINKLVYVEDDLLKIKDTMLISEVVYNYNDKGTYCLVTIVDKDTYSGSADDINIKTGFD